MILALGFLGTILAGSILLTLPIANRQGEITPYVTALFTATSAVCVTGLVVVDTLSYWSPFGQAVIAGLIQLGGLGFMTSSTILFLLIGHRLGLRERILLRESHGVSPMGGVLRLTRRVVLVTALIEGAGALLLFIRFRLDFPSDWAAWLAVFQSISAFNNAGSDLIGDFRSLTIYSRDPAVLLIFGLLFVLGGISFTVILDIWVIRNWRRLVLDTKLVLFTTGALLLAGTLGIVLLEHGNSATLGSMDAPSSLANALFSAATPRTAGFNSIDTGRMTQAGLLLTIALMYVGAASGSTGGGIKVNTFAVLTAAVWSSIRGKDRTVAFGRELPQDHINRALTVALLALGLVFVTQAVQADAGSEDALRDLGVRNFDVGVVAIGEDAKSSILITLLLKRLGVQMVVSKADDELHGEILRRVGADTVVYPESETGIRLAHGLATPELVDYLKVIPGYGVSKLVAPASMAGRTKSMPPPVSDEARIPADVLLSYLSKGPTGLAARGRMTRVLQVWRLLLRSSWAGYAAALLLTAAVTAVIGLAIGRVGVANISMVYLLAVLANTAAFGIGPAIAASFVAFLAFDWLFIDPLHTLTVADPAEWLQLLMFLATAVTTGSLAGELRRRAQVAQRREREAAVLYDVVRLMSESDTARALRAVAERLRGELEAVAVGIDLVEDGRSPVRAVAGSVDALPMPFGLPQGSAEVLASAPPSAAGPASAPGRWIRVVPPHKTARRGPTGDYHYHVVPVQSQGQRVGMLTLVHSSSVLKFGPAEDRLLSAVVGQVGLAVERRRLRQDAMDAEILRRSDDLKTALLNAVSHDLRTPLASILASAGALLQPDVEWSEAERHEFTSAIEQEARRLDQIVGRLLDLSRIEAGNLLIEKGWYDLGVLVDEVLGRLRPVTRQHRVVVSIPEDLPPVKLGYVEIDQVLSNLIENAVKYAPAGTDVQVSASRDRQEIRIEVSDRGPGIPREDLSRLFDPYYRARVEGTQPAGSGLGLAVAKGLVEAHGGHIWAENRPEGGASFVFTLPASESGGPRAAGEPDP